ncbi:MAG TPA: hypothetical protein VFI11_06975, partial [Anaerolineales bacterium]|nr:hypothetical protein [Anaerolineales bacterium]
MSVFRSRPPARNDTPPNGEMEPTGDLWTQLEHLRSVFRMTAALNATLNYERVLDMSLDAGAAALTQTGHTDPRLVCVLLLFDADQLRIASSRGLSAPDQRATLSGTRGVLERVLTTGNMEVFLDPRRDAELQRIVGLHTCRAAVVIPLVLG